MRTGRPSINTHCLPLIQMTFSNRFGHIVLTTLLASQCPNTLIPKKTPVSITPFLPLSLPPSLPPTPLTTFLPVLLPLSPILPLHRHAFSHTSCHTQMHDQWSGVLDLRESGEQEGFEVRFGLK